MIVALLAPSLTITPMPSPSSGTSNTSSSYPPTCTSAENFPIFLTKAWSQTMPAVNSSRSCDLRSKTNQIHGTPEPPLHPLTKQKT